MSSLGDALLRTPVGTAFLAGAAAVGRTEEALDDPGTTLCLTGWALAEVRRGSATPRLAALSTDPPPWLRAAVAAVDEADTAWWSTGAAGAVLRVTDQQDADAPLGVEVRDGHGRPRSAAEEADPHLHTFTTRDPVGPTARYAAPDDLIVVELDRPADLDARAFAALDDGTRPVNLTLRGALTIARPTDTPWPFQVAGVWWPRGAPPVASLGAVPEPPAPSADRIVHDHAWPPIGRPFDPRFDEGDEIDGSELEG